MGQNESTGGATGIKPGVKRSETPGKAASKRRVLKGRRNALVVAIRLSAVRRFRHPYRGSFRKEIYIPELASLRSGLYSAVPSALRAIAAARILGKRFHDSNFKRTPTPPFAEPTSGEREGRELHA